MKGGIISRLALEVWGPQDFFMDKVVLVPSDCRTPHIQIPFQETGQILQGVDDDLTAQEEDIICGVYRVFSDNMSIGKLSV